MTETTKLDIAEELETEEDIRAFLEASFEEAGNDTDSAAIVHALGIAARARGFVKIAASTGLDRAGLYRSFSRNGDPKISTVCKVAESLGYRLAVIPTR
ncbi:MAG: putative addiction module antidote protein [Acidobacteriota bacterium]|jgi:probable addiction module antidote protein|nr:putative addiction module antidote protein [Acidobacteriota bacterium]